jgi:PII-like signaling protein
LLERLRREGFAGATVIHETLLPILDEMVTGGALVTVERVRVIRYAAGEKRAK